MAPTTLEELQARYSAALTEAARLRGIRDKIDADVKTGHLPAEEGKVMRANIVKKIRAASDEARHLADAITHFVEDKEEPPSPRERDARIMDLLEQIRELDEQARAGVIIGDQYVRRWDAIAAQLEALDYPVETLRPIPKKDLPEEILPLSPEELEELEARAEEACKNARAWAAHQRRTTAQADAACNAAHDAVMDGKTDLEAAQAARDAANAIVEAGPTFDISGLLSRFGNLGDLKDDAVVGGAIADAIGGFFDTLGVTPETLEELKTSPIDRDRAAEIATGISVAAKTGLGLLYSIGVITEVASLGQIDTLVDAIDFMLENLGIDDIIGPLFTAPSYAGLVLPVRQYWMKQFRPTIPPIQDLRLFAVREAFPVETREEQFDEMERWGGYLGLDEYWRDRYLIAGYDRMDVRTALDMYYWRLWDKDQLTDFLKIADIHPDDHDAILSTIWRNPTRYERRHGYIMGVYDEADLEEYFHRDGLSDKDAVTATAAMTAYALNSERNAVARAAGRIYRETLLAVGGGIVEWDKALREAELVLEETRAALKAGLADVTQADVDRAEEDVEATRWKLGSLKRRAAGIRETAEAEFRAELEGLKIDGDRRDLWVRRYYMEAQIEVRPGELIYEEEPEAPYEPEG